MVFAADELFLRAEMELPESSYYEDFLLTENGVGLLRQFIDSLNEANIPSDESPQKRTVIVTGRDTEKFFLEQVFPLLPEKWHDSLSVAAITNTFLGSEVTVTGLLSGQDISSELLQTCGETLKWADQILICDCCLDDEERFIDDLTVVELSKKLGKPVIPVADDGQALIDAILCP